MAGASTRDRVRLVLAAAWLALICGQAPAQTVERVLMPGPVIEGHAKYEDDCRNCHIPFSRASQNGLCLACHKETAADVRQGLGFHGRLQPQPCRSCHTDHKGRDAKIAPVNEQTFDHAQTDFPLRGAHSDPKTACRSCHVPGKQYRATPGRCIDCHAKKDVHKGRLGNACADCHTESDWKETKVDHDKTRFPLRGKHAPLKCESCHKDTRYQETPTACIGCHRQDDKHKGRFGDKCETCHGDRDWKTLRFDHDTATRYPLRGRHRGITCESCHTGHLYRDKLQTTCIACHRRDDRHEGTLGEACGNCHTERNWKETRFDHGKTRFPLRGRHDAIECKSCHKSAVFKDAPAACVACHRRDDRHKGALGESCGDCHTERNWKDTKFDHDKTRFPLLGRHSRAKCESCHRDADYRRTPVDCYGCHKKDDAHEGQEGTKCESCHDANTWKKARFDHARARFALVGAHLVVACTKCHATPRYRDARSVCFACHDRDDVHKRRLGARCETCHNARTWKSWDFNHDRQTKFRLDGAHRKLECHACHRQPVQTRATLPASCVSCHLAEDVHDGAFGRQCEKCHVTDSFKRIKQRLGAGVAPVMLALTCDGGGPHAAGGCSEWFGRSFHRREH